MFPDFVFAVIDAPGRRRLVVLETKGAHLAGNEDTLYKNALFERLGALYADRRERRTGELELVGGSDGITVVCDLLMDTDWRGSFEARHFPRA